MNEREKIIRLWFDMWLTQQDLGIDDIFLEITRLYKGVDVVVENAVSE